MGKHPENPEGPCKFWFRASDDDGETWSADVRVNPGGDKGTPYFDTLRLLSSGRIIQPVRWCHWAGDRNRKTATCTVRGEIIDLEGHGHHPELEVAYGYFSDDQGMTWSRSKADICGWLQDGWGHFVPCDEPSLDQLPDGRLLMLIRSTIGRLIKCFSADEGTTWEIPQPTQLAASYSPCAVRRIPKTGDLDFVGELPAGFGWSDYATIAFRGEEVILSYPHCRGRHPRDHIGSMKHRVLPLDWFYAAP